MKKLLSVTLAIVLTLSLLTACSGGGESGGGESGAAKDSKTHCGWRRHRRSMQLG